MRRRAHDGSPRPAVGPTYTGRLGILADRPRVWLVAAYDDRGELRVARETHTRREHDEAVLDLLDAWPDVRETLPD